MTKQFSINSNFYFSRRCQEAVRVSGPSEEGWQLEIIVSPLLEVLSVNAWLQQLSPQGSRDVKKPSRHRNGLAIAPGHLTKGPASLRGWLVAIDFTPRFRSASRSAGCCWQCLSRSRWRCECRSLAA